MQEIIVAAHKIDAVQKMATMVLGISTTVKAIMVKPSAIALQKPKAAKTPKSNKI